MGRNTVNAEVRSAPPLVSLLPAVHHAAWLLPSRQALWPTLCMYHSPAHSRSTCGIPIHFSKL